MDHDVVEITAFEAVLEIIEECVSHFPVDCIEKYSGTGIKKKCSGWQGWRDLRNPEKQFSDWQTAANECCRTMGLR